LRSMPRRKPSLPKPCGTASHEGTRHMRVTEFTRGALAVRREARQLLAAGYRRHETDREIVRGGRTREVILDAKISADRRYVWTKLGSP
jgi:hypothetical protein